MDLFNYSNFYLGLTREELRDILKRNGQTQHGEKNVLITRIKDGETYGQLPKCPACLISQLRLDLTNPDLVICPGYISILNKETVRTTCGYQTMAVDQVRSKRWIGQKYFTQHISEMELFQPALAKIKKNEDQTRMLRKKQGTMMKNMYNIRTKFAHVGDLIKVRLDQRDIKNESSRQHVILGIAYNVTVSGGAYFVSTSGIAGKRKQDIIVESHLFLSLPKRM